MKDANGPTRRRLLALGAVLLASAVGVGGYAVHAVRRSNGDATPTRFARLEALPPAASPGAGQRGFILYRNTALGNDYGKVAMAWLDSADVEHAVAELPCDRVHYARAEGSRTGIGLCLQATRSAVASYRALLFDDSFAIRKVFDLAGPPSRARVSPNGHLAAFTVFINGHAYSNPGFTTRTSIVDTARGEMLVDDLERWPVTRDGTAFKAKDFNLWGVTFARDGHRFFATLASAGRTYLVEGNLATRDLKVVREDVECPSLSPDDSRIAYKHHEPADAQGRVRWSLAVLELANGKITPLAREQRNVDDQVEWVDLQTVAYGLPKDGNQAYAESVVWTMDVDGKTAPRPLLSFATSPAVSH